MRKNGHDRMGRQRWQCDECRLTAGTRNNTKRRRTQLAEFLDWLLEAAPQRKRPESARNFRKRVKDIDFIEKTELIDKVNSKRGAALYRFNKKAYEEDPSINLK